MSDMPQPPSPQAEKSLEAFLELYLVKKAPYTLPHKVKLFLAKLAPWANILVIIVTLPIILSVLGFSAIAVPFAAFGGASYLAYSWFWIVLALIQVVLLFLALPGLFKQSLSGWRWMLYANLIMVVTGLFQFSIGSLISSVIGLYFLFQIKELYKK